MMRRLLILALAVLGVFVKRNYGGFICARGRLAKGMMLDGSQGKVFRHIDDAAFVNSMELENGTGSGCDGPASYGFDQGKVSVWAAKGCSGKFQVEYLEAYCTMVSMDSSKFPGNYVEMVINDPCYQEGSSYSMHVKKDKHGRRESNGKCDFDDEHRGIGDYYGFNFRHVWADNGCGGNFTVCEVGVRMQETPGPN